MEIQNFSFFVTFPLLLSLNIKEKLFHHITDNKRTTVLFHEVNSTKKHPKKIWKNMLKLTFHFFLIPFSFVCWKI